MFGPFPIDILNSVLAVDTHTFLPSCQFGRIEHIVINLVYNISAISKENEDISC